MNANMNLDLSKVDVKQVLAIARRAQVYVFGLLLICAFAYTAYVVNGALNVQANPAAADPATQKKSTITFDKATIEGLKNLSSVPGDVPRGNLGTSDPF
jgi:hypothetical protein